MAHSIEVRVPFTDFGLITLAFQMPAKYKYKNNFGKLLLRKAMKQILPKGLSEKKKQGFSPPEGSWYRDESLPYVKNILLSKKTLGREFFNSEYIKKIITEHSTGKKNHRLIIWSLLSFEWWCRIFLDRSGKKLQK